MRNEQQVGVYKLHKLARMSNTTFDKSIKVLERDLHPVHHDYADKINAQSEINGLLYEYDDKATKLYWDKKPYKAVKEFTEFEEVDELAELRKEYQELSGKKAFGGWDKDKLTEKLVELKK
jgi:hypothetical protein